MINKTASKISLLAICGFPFRVDVDTPDGTTSASAERGLVVHAAIEATIESRPLPPMSKTERRYYDAWLAEWWQERSAQRWQAERAYAIHPATGEGRALPEVEIREYPDIGPGWVYCTVDALRFGTRKAYVTDWKTGETAPAAHRNAQLYTIALAIARAHDIERVAISITHVRPNGVAISKWALDRHDLDEWQQTLADAIARVPSAEPVPGSHCHSLYCPLRDTCEAANQHDDDDEFSDDHQEQQGATT